MTSAELNKLQIEVREHKTKGHSSNITLKISQVERLLTAAQSALPQAEIVHFDIAAEVRREEVQQRNYENRWANYARKIRFEKQEQERQQLRKNRREALIAKWKTYAGNQKLGT